MSDEERTVLDEYLEQGKPSANALSSQFVYEHSGHRLFCPKCRDFRRTKVEWQKDQPGIPLRVTCKKCGAHSDFIVYKTGMVPKWFSDRSRAFARKGAQKFLREEALRGDG